MKKGVFYFLIIILVVILSLSFFWFYEARIFVGRASISRSSFSIENSYVFATPLKARANGQEKIRVTVFVLNDQGLGVMGKKVFLGQKEGLIVEVIQGLTDQLGKAIFDLTATKPGEYYLEVKVEETLLPQRVRISFY